MTSVKYVTLLNTFWQIICLRYFLGTGQKHANYSIALVSVVGDEPIIYIRIFSNTLIALLYTLCTC